MIMSGTLSDDHLYQFFPKTKYLVSSNKTLSNMSKNSEKQPTNDPNNPFLLPFPLGKYYEAQTDKQRESYLHLFIYEYVLNNFALLRCLEMENVPEESAIPEDFRTAPRTKYQHVWNMQQKTQLPMAAFFHLYFSLHRFFKKLIGEFPGNRVDPEKSAECVDRATSPLPCATQTPILDVTPVCTTRSPPILDDEAEDMSFDNLGNILEPVEDCDNFQPAMELATAKQRNKAKRATK